MKNGIIKDDLSWHLNKKKKNFDLIITSSKREYNSLLNINYGYEKNNLALTGLPRFDNLIEIHNRIQCEKIIIIYPTWRSYIKGTRDLITLKSIESESFIEALRQIQYEKKPNETCFIHTTLVPYIMPIGSRMPMAQNHMGQNLNTNFNNIGGSIYGRITMIR